MSKDDKTKRKDSSTATGIDATGDNIESCDNFVENTSKGSKTVTVKIKNTDEDFGWVPDIDDVNVSEEHIEPGKTKTYIINLEPGKSLHANGKGKYEVISVS